MSDEIVKILDDLGQRFGIAIDWTSGNVMPYLQDLMSRYINYEVMTSVVWIVVALIVIIGLSIGIPAINKHANKVLEEDYSSDWDVGKPLLVGIFVIIIVCCLCCIVGQVLDIVTCYTIPEKMVFEYINSLT